MRGQFRVSTFEYERLDREKDATFRPLNKGADNPSGHYGQKHPEVYTDLTDLPGEVLGHQTIYRCNRWRLWRRRVKWIERTIGEECQWIFHNVFVSQRSSS